MVLPKRADEYTVRLLIRSLCSLVLALALIAGAAPPVRAAEKPTLSAALDRLYLTAYDETINRHVVDERDGTTYVSTGDIQAEWLRDASAVVKPYIGLSEHDPDVAQTLRGVVAREARYILLDPYANAFSADYHVVERKFEVDSLLYPIWFAYQYYTQSGDRSIFTPQVQRAFQRSLSVLRDEQHHFDRSHYRHPQLADRGRGSAVRYTGMIWDGFRPSDDPCRYQFNIPVNMFAVVVMRQLSDIEHTVYRNDRMANNAWGLSVQVQRGVEQHGMVDLPGVGRIYAYEVDGRGHANVMDDANIPSLLSIPYFGYLPVNDAMYQRTRAFVLSPRNPYFYRGRYAEGIGSPHTPNGYVWPLALVMQALTARDGGERQRVLGYIAASDVGDHRLHESFNANWPEQFTRADFAWPNALYAELMLGRH